MPALELKLKQASAVLGVTPKDLQNLVQFGIVRPTRRGHVYWFDEDLLLRAKAAIYLKKSLGTSAGVLVKLTDALFHAAGRSRAGRKDTVRLLFRPQGGNEPVEIRVPLRSLAQEINQRLPLAAAYADFPRGRKRPGWKEEFLQSLERAAGDLRDLSEAKILEVAHAQRRRKKSFPEVTSVASSPKETASGRR